MSLDTMCRTFAQLQRHTTVKDTSGGETFGPWPNVGSLIACDCQPASSQTIERWNQRELQVSHTLYLTDNIGALAGDRIVITNPDDSTTRIFRVEGQAIWAAGYDQWPEIVDVIEEPQTQPQTVPKQ